MVHEIPHKDIFFKEIESILKPNGLVLVVEPPFHVTNNAFNQTVVLAKQAGLIPDSRPRVLFSKAVTLKKAKNN